VGHLRCAISVGGQVLGARPTGRWGRLLSYAFRIALSSPCPYTRRSPGMAKRRRVKTTEINVRTSPELKRASQEAAAKERRTLSSLVEYLLDEYCRKVGTLKARRR